MDAVSTAVFACSTMQDLGSLDGPFFVVVWRQGSLSAVSRRKWIPARLSSAAMGDMPAVQVWPLRLVCAEAHTGVCC